MVNPSYQTFPATPYAGQMPASSTLPGLPMQSFPGYGYPYMGSTMGMSSMSPASFGGYSPYIMGQTPPTHSPMSSMMGGMGSTGGMTGHPSTGMPYPTLPKTSGGVPKSSTSQPMGYPGMSSTGTSMGFPGMGMPGMSPSSSGMSTTGMGQPSLSPSTMQSTYGTGMMSPTTTSRPPSTIPFMSNPQQGMMPPSSAGSAYGNSGLLGPSSPYSETYPYPRSTVSSAQVSSGTWSGNEIQNVPLYSAPIDPEAYGFPSTEGFRWHVPAQDTTDFSI